MDEYDITLNGLKHLGEYLNCSFCEGVPVHKTNEWARIETYEGTTQFYITNERFYCRDHLHLDDTINI